MDLKAKVFSTVLLFALIFIDILCKRKNLITDEKQAEDFLAKVNEELTKQLNILTEANWNHESNINNKTTELQVLASKVFSEFQRNQSLAAKKYDWTHFKEYNKRQFNSLAVIGTAALNKEDEHKLITVKNQMETIYSSAKVCVGGKCNLELDPDLDEIMSTSKNYTELTEAWLNWRDASGKKMRQDFITYYTLGNKAAKLNELPDQKFNTFDDLWLFSWEAPDLKKRTAELLDLLKPFYQKIHAYIRMKLNAKYPGKLPKDGTIPAHLLGNMWAQTWGNIMESMDGVDPYPDLTPIDVTKTLRDKGFTSKKLFELSEKFFVDLGLEKMTNKFWKLSIFDKIKDRVMVCHASAWDFFSSSSDDYRIKMCTNINMEDLITIHHEMGHIQYFQQYRNQPTLYRDGANPGFHEAIGDLLALSVATPKHLKKIGLLQLDDNPELSTKINTKFQLKMALGKFMFLPFGYLMDKWRWDVFSGKVSSKDMNRHWWKLRGELQGLSPPVKRSENDFDPGCKYHIPASVEYIRYFASHILQFQFHKKLCSFREKSVPLHECDIDGDLEAGAALKKMLEKGSSEKWTKQLKELVGTERMDVQPLLEYFKPLQEFLDQQLKGQDIGWKFNVDDYFTSNINSGEGVNGIVTSTTEGKGTPTVNTAFSSLFVCILLANAFIRFVY